MGEQTLDLPLLLAVVVLAGLALTLATIYCVIKWNSAKDKPCDPYKCLKLKKKRRKPENDRRYRTRRRAGRDKALAVVSTQVEHTSQLSLANRVEPPAQSEQAESTSNVYSEL